MVSKLMVAKLIKNKFLNENDKINKLLNRKVIQLIAKKDKC